MKEGNVVFLLGNLPIEKLNEWMDNHLIRARREGGAETHPSADIAFQRVERAFLFKRSERRVMTIPRASGD
jgi:hypothetical protein